MAHPTDKSQKDDQAAGQVVSLILDEATIPRQRAPIEQERRIAIANLLECNSLRVKGLCSGSYVAVVTIEASDTLGLHVRDEQGGHVCLSLPLGRLAALIKDYRIVCENYYQAMVDAPPSTIETLDEARRALHDDGAQMICNAFTPTADLDHETARGLLTLVTAILSRS
ncbi:MAG: UPF0262 family protein [Pseudomonadota bacterium]